jgi:hypothetical protein
MEQTIKLIDLLKLFKDNQYLQIFSSDKKNKEVMLGLYRVDNIPEKLKDLYVGYISSGTKEDIQHNPLEEKIDSLILLDVYDNVDDALLTQFNVTKSI